MAERIKLVQGDTGPQIKLTLSDETTGEALDLTGATVTLRLRASGSDVVILTRVALVNPALALEGIAIIFWQSGDLDLDPGPYEGEVEIVFADQMRQTVYDLLRFTVREDFG